MTNDHDRPLRPSRRRLLQAMGAGIAGALVPAAVAHADPGIERSGRDPRPPRPAGEAGYRARTFGAGMTVAPDPTAPLRGANWAPFSFFESAWMDVDITHNRDGSISMNTGDMGNNYGGQLCTAVYDSTKPDYIRGIAFGGGAYFEATFSFEGFPSNTGCSFWANDIESMAGAGGGDLRPRHWPGQPADFGNWLEIDMTEFNPGTADQYGMGMHNFYGTATNWGDANTGSYPGFVSPITVPAGTDFSDPHRYGFLWVPARTGRSPKRGVAKWFFDDVQVGETVEWDPFDPAAGPPPVQGASAFSVIDTRHFALILGLGSTTNPMTIYSVEVWQQSAAHNIKR